MPELAPFIAKNALAASHVLRDFNRSEFEQTLLGTPVRLSFGADAGSAEGRACLDLGVRLLARLYPTLAVHDTTGTNEELAQSLRALARSIHPGITLPDDAPDAVTLVVGRADPAGGGDRVFVGSQGWTATIDPASPVPLGGTANPFGPGSAACLGAAAVFRFVFADWLPGLPALTRRTMSALHPWADPTDEDLMEVPEADLEETHLVGLGAIGNAALWGFARARGLRGRLHLVDGQAIEISNLQRYVLATNADGEAEATKTAVAVRELEGTELVTVPHPKDWDAYLAQQQTWDLPRVVVALDTGRDRISVQASLPRVALNAFTGHRDLGVSRHPDFLLRPCLCCLYFPQKKGVPLPQEIANDLGIPHREVEVRGLLQQKIPVPRTLLDDVAAALGLDVADLLRFEGDQLEAFHGVLTCGGELLRLGAAPAGRGVEAPLAFQSALAGVLLAAETVADAAGLRPDEAPTQTRSDVLATPGLFTSDVDDPITKGVNGRCLCEDRDYQDQYARKYGLDVQSGRRREAA